MHTVDSFTPAKHLSVSVFKLPSHSRLFKGMREDRGVEHSRQLDTTHVNTASEVSHTQRDIALARVNEAKHDMYVHTFVLLQEKHFQRL